MFSNHRTIPYSKQIFYDRSFQYTFTHSVVTIFISWSLITPFGISPFSWCCVTRLFMSFLCSEHATPTIYSPDSVTTDITSDGGYRQGSFPDLWEHSLGNNNKTILSLWNKNLFSSHSGRNYVNIVKYSLQQHLYFKPLFSGDQRTLKNRYNVRFTLLWPPEKIPREKKDSWVV